MKKTVLLLILVLFSINSSCQNENKTDFNFGFERISKSRQLPETIINWSAPAYKLKVDSIIKHSGNNSLLIELVGDKTFQSFGSGAYSIPGIYLGNQIELQAYLKFENVSDGPIGLMLRIDGEGRTLKFDNMQQKNIQGTSDWALYSVKLPLPEDAKTIFIGAILSGTGKLWVDDFKLLIDGKDISKAKTKVLPVYLADKDTEFDKGSGITNLNLTPSKIEDLSVLGKVWGFLKYYHPAIAKGDYNWDYELFRILPEILKAENIGERNEVIFGWISKLGEVLISDQEIINDSLIKLKPDLHWISNSQLGEKLVNQLMQIKDTKHSNKHYYIAAIPNVSNPQFSNEKSYNSITIKTDIGFRLLALYRYWNIIEYYFPYKYLIEDNWNDVLPEYIPKFVNSTSELEYKLCVLSLIARIHDTHANIWGNDPVLQPYKGKYYAPLIVKFIEEKAVVTGYNDKLSGEKSGLQKGDIILSINKKPIDLIIKEKLPITPASNYPTQLRDLARDILRSNDSISEITYKRGSVESSLKLKLMSQKEAGLLSGTTKRDTCYKLLTPEIAYIFPGSIKNVYLPKIMNEVKGTKGLIIDMRTYPSEFIVFTLGAYLMPEPTNFVKFSKMSITSPGLFTYSTPLKVGVRNNDYYKGKIVIIINEITQSQAEYTTMAFRVAPNVKVIGSTTAGADGNVSQFNLPGGITTMISGIGVYYPDGKETQRVGIIPDIEVKPSIKGIKDGKDELLEKAIEIINLN